MQYADEVVIVNKPIPMKARNSAEEKIRVTHHRVDVTAIEQNSSADAKDERDFKMHGKEFRTKVKVLKES